LVEEVERRQLRDAVENFFKANALPFTSDEQEAEFPPDDRRSFAESILALYVGIPATALGAGTLVARTDHHLTRPAADVDERGLSHAAGGDRASYKRIGDITKDSAERLSESSEHPTRTISYLSLFEAPRALK
jgi:hypothetical protein